MGDYYNLEEGDFFVRLPNESVWNLEDNGITLKNELKYPFTVAVLYRLVENTNPINETMFSINDLVTSCGYKKDKDNIKNFKDLLNKLQDKGIIYNVSIPLDKAKYNSFIRCKLNLEVETNFFMIYHKYFKTVMESDYTASVKNNVFTFLCYILARNYVFTLKEASLDLGTDINTIKKDYAIIKEMKLIELKEELLNDFYYVYIHINKLNNEVLYVGKGTGKRYKDLNARNEIYLNYIKELGENNIECKIVKTFNNESEAFIFEEGLTKTFKSIGQAKYCIKIGK